MRIALDAMGGDYAPDAVIEGAILAKQSLPANVEIVLVGREAVIKQHLDKHNTSHTLFSIVNAEEVIEMGEHPTKALAQKTNSSISVGFGLLKTEQAQAFCSAGNTGAMLVGAMFSIKSIPGVIRPAIIGYVPKENGGSGIMLDVGANADCKPEMLNQFAELGSLYAQYVLGIDNPKIGLMNLGEEEQKGSLLTQATYQLLKQNKKINFAGNLEGRDVFNDKSDVIVCDGFTGNIILKMAESVYEIMHARGIKTDSFFDGMNYEAIGGSPIIGVQGNVIIGHGVSSPLAIKNMLYQAYQMIEADIHTKIKNALNEYPS